MAKILIVDDEMSIKITFSKFLSNEGYEVYAADNTDQAFEYILSRNIDLVITDIVMPRYTGIDLIKKLRQLKPGILIIVMTGEPSLETAIQAVQNHVNDYLIKPISKETLLQSVIKTLDYKHIIIEKKNLEINNLKYKEELKKAVSEKTENLKIALKAAIKTICSIHEQRDSHTLGHQRRVGNLAVQIAEKMRLDSFTTDSVGIAGYLHDIGNVLVPLEILKKPEPLSTEDRSTMQQHAEYGYRILKNIDLPWPVADIVYKHHERLDGSGYPRGLKGDEIELAPRILAVADVIEGTLSPRPHRSAKDINTLVYELEDGKYSLYDDQVVNAAVKFLLSDDFALDESTISIDFESIT